MDKLAALFHSHDSRYTRFVPYELMEVAMSRRRGKRDRTPAKPIKDVKGIKTNIAPKDPDTLKDDVKSKRRRRYEGALEKQVDKAVADTASTDRTTQEEAVTDAAAEARDTYESETGDAADVSVVVEGKDADGGDEKIEVDVKSEKDKDAKTKKP